MAPQAPESLFGGEESAAGASTFNTTARRSSEIYIAPAASWQMPQGRSSLHSGPTTTSPCCPPWAANRTALLFMRSATRMLSSLGSMQIPVGMSSSPKPAPATPSADPATVVPCISPGPNRRTLWLLVSVTYSRPWLSKAIPLGKFISSGVQPAELDLPAKTSGVVASGAYRSTRWLQVSQTIRSPFGLSSKERGYFTASGLCTDFCGGPKGGGTRVAAFSSIEGKC